MSYHGFGATYPTPIQKAPDVLEQPTSVINPMAMIQTNPMLPAGEAAAGDQAMMMEMQARSGYDPDAFQQPVLQPGLPQVPAPVGPVPGPVPGVNPQSSKEQVAAQAPKLSDQQIVEYLVKLFKTVWSGGKPEHKLELLAEWAGTHGKNHLIMKAEQIASGQPTPAYLPIQSGEAGAGQPAEPIMNQGPPMTVPNPAHPVTGQSNLTGQITTYVDETGLNPAQPGAPVPSAPPPPPTNYDPAMGPITGQAPPSQGPIPGGTPSQGPIPEGTAPVGPIAPGVSATTPSGYVTPTTAAPVVAQAKSNIVPIAIAAGAALLLSRLL